MPPSWRFLYPASILVACCFKAFAAPRREAVGKHEVIWEPPSSGPLRGIVFLFHGCNHGASDFWPPQPGCSDCLGLPEERAIVREAHARGLVTIAISSWDRSHSKCWQPVDVSGCLWVIETMRSRLQLEDAPSFLLGASSGGGFTGMLASRSSDGTLTAISSQIMPLNDHFFAMDRKRVALELVSMPRDDTMEPFVQNNVATAKNLKMRWAARHCLPLSVTPHLFSDRDASISPAVSAAIGRALGEAGLINADTGLLLEDPRESDWRSELQHAKYETSELRQAVLALPMEADASALSEIMNVAFAKHEFCATDIKLTFDFFNEAAAAAALL